MQDKQLFEYAVIRVVPRVEREEFMNVGIILYCPVRGFLQSIFTLDEKRLQHLCPTIDMEELREHLTAFEKIALGSPDGGPIARLDIASRFRWLTATRSTIIQSSPVHPGFCNDPEEALKHLHEQMVL